MSEPYKIALSALVDEFRFEVLVRPEHFEEIQVVSNEVNRPGLALSGFFGCFEPERIQLIGNAENRYLRSLDAETSRKLIRDFVDARPVAILITTGIEPDPTMIERAKEVGVPVLRTAVKTSPIMAALI